MTLPKGMGVKLFAKKGVAGIEAGKLEVRPGLANVMKILSRIAPRFILKQMAKMAPSLGPPILKYRSQALYYRRQDVNYEGQ
jgi:hypothetical protein